MKNPFQSAPRCVQWAAAILIALPVLDLVVALGTVPHEQLLAQWPTRFSSTAVHFIIALGILLGSNSIRLIFTALTLFNGMIGGVGLVLFGGSLIGAFYHYLVFVAPGVALVLCCLPAANRHFKPPKETDLSPDSPAAVPARTAAAIPGIRILIATGALVLLGAAFLAYRSHRADTQFRGMEVEAFLPGQARNIAIGASQYFLEYPEATSVPFGIDANGAITGPLRHFFSRVEKGVRVVGEKIERSEGTFSLQHDDAFAGKPVVFNFNGEMVPPQSPK